jgi:class 3 adenylate cyclase
MSAAEKKPEPADEKPAAESIPASKIEVAGSKLAADLGRQASEALAYNTNLLRDPYEGLKGLENHYNYDLAEVLAASSYNASDWTKQLTMPIATGFSNLMGTNIAPYLLDEEATQKARELNDKIATLRKEIEQKADELSRVKVGAAEAAKARGEIETRYAALKEQEQFNFLLSRVNAAARTKLLKSAEFQKKFLDGSMCETFVISVDIRRSTELMLKAKSAQLFAQFITTLCRELETVIMDCYGVFDKFTGDGVLAFFPDFFSGKDAGFYSILAAERCHRAFEKRYREFRSSFTSVLTDVGLGIGIDYGPAHLFQIAGGLSIVGVPVVYACRMSGTRPGTTLLNQQGYERISERFSPHCFFKETELEIKHEGKVLAYEVSLNGKEFRPASPEWFEEANAAALKKEKK